MCLWTRKYKIQETGLRWCFRQQKICLQYGRPGFHPWFGKILLEKGIATHSGIVTWEIPRTEEPGRLQFMGSQRVGHDRTHVHARKLLYQNPCYLPFSVPFSISGLPRRLITCWFPLEKSEPSNSLCVIGSRVTYQPGGGTKNCKLTEADLVRQNGEDLSVNTGSLWD